MPTSSLVVAATGFSVFALVIVVALAVQVGRLRRAYDALVPGDGTSFAAAVEQQSAAVRDLHDDVSRLHDDLASRPGTRSGLSRVAVVRYDAFGDLAGALSFSAALLDDAGDGLVLSSINGRSETRTYAKGIAGGSSEAPLSPEEQEAVEQALAPAQRPARRPGSSTASSTARAPRARARAGR